MVPYLYFFDVDAGYLSTDIYKVFMPTVWIPFVNTNKQNGCMEVTEIK